jgi:hypothetical protein
MEEEKSEWAYMRGRYGRRRPRRKVVEGRDLLEEPPTKKYVLR